MIGNIYNKLRRITSNQLYYPEIDGIRFLAIILVILFHTYGYFTVKSPVVFADNPSSYPLLRGLMENGDRGVELFFVLSGFILCLPFAKEYIRKEKKVQLKKYYLRRVTRLEPPYFIAMTALFLMQLFMHIHPVSVLLPSWLASLIYSHNIIFHHTPLLTVVAWSLEIEIQFYILAPLLFRVLMLPVATRRGLLVAATIAMVLLQAAFPPAHNMLSLYGFAQYFFIGILLADLYVSGTAEQLFNKRFMAFAAAVALVTVVYLPIKEKQYEVASASMLLTARLFFPFLIGLLYYIVLKNDIVKRVFSFRFMPVIGGMCYSIYLLHYTIISVIGRVTIHWKLTDYYLPNLLLQVVLLMVPILLISSVFFYFVERPFMAGKWTDMLMKKPKKTA